MPVPIDDGRERLEVLQPVELPGLELARRHRRVHDDLDDGRRQPVHLVRRARRARRRASRRARAASASRAGCVAGVERRDVREERDDVRVAVLRARHRPDDAPGVVRVVVAVERDGAVVRQVAREEALAAALHGASATVPSASTVAAWAWKYCFRASSSKVPGYSFS